MKYEDYKRQLESVAKKAVYQSKGGSEQDRLVKKVESMLEAYRKLSG